METEKEYIERTIETELKISFEESLSESSINLIQKVLEESLGFKTEIERIY